MCQKTGWIRKINEIKYSKSRPIFYLKSLKGTENIPWLCNIGAQGTCLQKNFLKKSQRKTDQKLLTERRFIRAGEQTLEKLQVKHSFSWDHFNENPQLWGQHGLRLHNCLWKTNLFFKVSYKKQEWNFIFLNYLWIYLHLYSMVKASIH